MKFEKTQVWGFEHAIRGMRNPKNSWDKSDSMDCAYSIDGNMCGFCDEPVYTDLKCPDTAYGNTIAIGPNDMKLMKALIKGGPEHRKFMRQIFVSVDITAPLYWWKEFDTYKVGTVANSTSTMHKMLSRPIEMNCFESDDYDPDLYVPYVNQEEYLTEAGKELGFEAHWHVEHMWITLLEYMEDLRQASLNEKDPIIAKKLWKELIRVLPEGWLQTRTVTLNYEVIYAQVHQRKNHKQNEWSGIDQPDLPNFIAWAHSLPYADILLFDKELPSVIEEAVDRIPKTIFSQKNWEKRAEKFLNEHGVVTRDENGNFLNSHDIFCNMGALVPEDAV